MDDRSVQPVYLLLFLLGLLGRSWQLDPPATSEDGGSSSEALEEPRPPDGGIYGSFRLENSNSTNSSPSEVANDSVPIHSVVANSEAIGSRGDKGRGRSEGDDGVKLNQTSISKGNESEHDINVEPLSNSGISVSGNKNAREPLDTTSNAVEDGAGNEGGGFLVSHPRGDTDPVNSSSLKEMETNKTGSNANSAAITKHDSVTNSEEDGNVGVNTSKTIVEDQIKEETEKDVSGRYSGNISFRLASVIKEFGSYSSMSWLDALMLHHRGTLFIVINTIFMVIWVIVGMLSLYRLLGLPWCSPYVSRTQYLVIHLLIFTASTFEFVQLIHLCYGSHKGLPLFLTLLLTHTPTPCLAVSLIIMTYCIFASTRVPVFGSYFPPMIYVSILAAFVIVFSFVGDIIVGVTRNSIFLIVIRVLLMGLCLVCLLSFDFNYRKITGVALIMRREFRGELKALAIPVDSPEDSQDARLHLKKMLLPWTRLVLLSSIFGILMCVFSFCLSLFFTVSFVPLWAFWVLHSALFVTQIVVVVSLMFGATMTLMYNSRRSLGFKFFLPSYLNGTTNNGSFIKRGNFIYQRVSVSNGPTVPTPISPPPTILENEEQEPLRNNNLIPELGSQPYRSKVNLKRSATFNCASPYGFHRSNIPPYHPGLYPVLSDHILPYSYSHLYPDFIRQNVNDSGYEARCHKPTLQVSSSFNYPIPSRERYRHSAYARRYPYREFNPSETYPELSGVCNRPIQKGVNVSTPIQGSPPPVSSNSYGLAGTVEALDVTYHIPGVTPVTPEDRNVLRQIPRNHSFNTSDRQGYRKEPPEKPARKTEPILVKGVLKDNVNLEMALPTKRSGTDSKSFPYPAHKNSNAYILEKGFLRDKGQVTSLGTPPNIKKYPESTDNHYGRINNDKFSTPSIPYQTKESPSPSLSPVTPRSASAAISIANSSPDKSESDTSHPVNRYNTDLSWKRDIDLEEKRDNNSDENRIEEENKDREKPSDTDSKSLLGSAAPKTTSLKRNHSTAGEFTPRGTGDDATSMAVSPDSNGINKYPWYGTWGGRRKSRKKMLSVGNDNVSGSALNRLSASKSSLSNIYEKLKPRHKSTKKKKKKKEKEKNCTSETSVKSPEDGDYKGSDAVMNPPPSESDSESEEEEDELLPRLEEDMDLASEIFRSSTVLADFYSLDRSFLKKRKEERLKRAGGNPHDDRESECSGNGVTSSQDEDSFKSLKSSSLEEKT